MENIEETNELILCLGSNREREWNIGRAAEPGTGMEYRACGGTAARFFCFRTFRSGGLYDSGWERFHDPIP